MSRYKAYTEYRNSGVEWLGLLPSHWGVKRLGQFFDERREKVSDEDYRRQFVAPHQQSSPR